MKRDSLLLFLLLAVGFIAITSRDVLSLIGFDREGQYAIQMDAEHELDFPDCGVYDSGDQIKLFNKTHQLSYSLDGGDHFYEAEELNIESLKNPNLLFETTSFRWQSSHGNFPFVKSIRIRLSDSEKQIRSKDKVVTYFGEELTQLPMVCINTSQAGLFGWESGIMIPGTYSSEQPNYPEKWWWKNGNYQKRGVKWERRASFQYFEDGKLLAEQDCGIRISGNATRSFPQKSMRVYARPIYGNETFKHAFWENGIDEAASMVLRNSGNDNGKTLFADLFLQHLSRNCHVLIQEGKAVNVFLNGNYWGLYNLRERIDLQFVAEKEECKITEVTLLEGHDGSLKDGYENHKKSFDQLIQNLPEVGQMNEESYDALKAEVSMKSFIDYIILETYYANEDWPSNNTIWYKTEDKKWKWLLNDLDYSMAYSGPHNVNSDHFAILQNSDSYLGKLFSTLIAYEKFKTKFKKRIKELFETDLNVNRIQEEFENMMALYEPHVPMSIERWRNIRSMDEWRLNCQNNLDFLLKRQEIYLKQVEAL